MYDVEKY